MSVRYPHRSCMATFLRFVPFCMLRMVTLRLVRASVGIIGCMQGCSKSPVRPVLMKMPPQTTTSQWGYTQIWKQGMRHTARSSPQTCIDPRMDMEAGNLRRSASASRLTCRTQDCSKLERVVSTPVALGDGKLSQRAKNINDGSTTASRARSQDRIHNLRCSGIYEAIGSGVAHKVPSTGEYYGIGRFTPACYRLDSGSDKTRLGRDI